MNDQRMIQPRDCCGLTANACECRIRAPSRATHPAAIVVGTESRATPSDGVAGRASDRRRVHQRQEGTHADAIPGTALRRHQIWQVSAALRRGAAQPAHPADAVPATRSFRFWQLYQQNRIPDLPIRRG
jgi:hypothetical protein